MIECRTEEQARLEAIKQMTRYENIGVRIFYNKETQTWWVEREDRPEELYD